MKISIEVYAPSAFLKSGKLKKRAQHELERMMVDVEPYSPTAVDDFIKETAQVIKRDYTAFTSPYFFTHIQATNKATGEKAYIYESCNDLITSPVKLLATLTA